MKNKKEYQKKYQKKWRKKNKIRIKKYLQKNRFKIKEYKQKWRKKNKTRIKKVNQKWRKKNKSKIKKWNIKNKVKMKKYRQKWWIKNKIKMKKARQKYREKNRIKLSEKQRLYYHKKINSDPVFKITRICRGRLRVELKRYLLIKKESTNKYLGCSYFKLKLYLEAKFKPGMTWKNHGKKWHIDHIIPFSNFDLSKEKNIYKVCNYKNLQPLLIEEHKKKTAMEIAKNRRKKR